MKLQTINLNRFFFINTTATFFPLISKKCNMTNSNFLKPQKAANQQSVVIKSHQQFLPQVKEGIFSMKLFDGVPKVQRV